MTNYNLHLIKPSQLVDGKPLKFLKAMSPTLALPYLAALTPPEFYVRIIDETVEEIDYDEPVDLVGVTSLLPQVPRALQIADDFRARGVKVVMGGVGASSIPELVSPHVDSLVVGEADTLWPEVLEDFKRNCLKPVYRAKEFCSLENMPFPRFDLLKRDLYLQAPLAAASQSTLRIPIETSRGCPHNCAFCYVSAHFGRKQRFRPVAEVVQEVAHFPGAYVFFVDDNIAANPSRAKDLFRALKPLNIRWVGQFSAMAARDAEMLDLAAESGCVNAFLGLESISPETLSTVRKEFSLSQEIPETLGAFRKAGIDIQVSLVFGFDGDTLDSIDRTIDVMIEEKVHLVYAFILTPIPGTDLHEQMRLEGRLLHSDYSLYDAAHVVFRPKHMSPDELYEKFWEAYGRFFTAVAMLRRFSDGLRWVRQKRFRSYLHNLIGNLYFRRMVADHFHPLAGGIPKRE